MTDDASGGPSPRPYNESHDSEAMSRKLKDLQRQVTIHKWLLLLGILAAIGYFAIPSTVVADVRRVVGLPDTPQVALQSNAREFGTYNRLGDRVLLENEDKWGLPTVLFWDLKKTCKMMLRIAPEGGGNPIVELYDANGPRVSLSLDGDDTSSVRLFGKQHKGGIALSVTDDGVPSLIMTKPSGEVSLALPEGAKAPNSEEESPSTKLTRPSR